MANKNFPFTLSLQKQASSQSLKVYNFFISDLHLSADSHELNQRFASFIAQLQTLADTASESEARQAKPANTTSQTETTAQTEQTTLPEQRHIRLFILGDFLALGIGDFIPEWFVPYQQALQALSQQGVEIFFTVGNRDFLLGKRFAQGIGATLIPENTLVDFKSDNQGNVSATFSTMSATASNIVTYGNNFECRKELVAEFKRRKHDFLDEQKLHSDKYLAKDEQALRIWLCHGDNLCLSDEPYQKYRKYIRSSLVRGIEKIIPTSLVKSIAKHISAKSVAKRKALEQMHANPNNQEASAAQSPAMRHMADIDLLYTQYLAEISQAQVLIYGHIHRQRIMSWETIQPQTSPDKAEKLTPRTMVTVYRSPEAYTDLGYLEKVKTPEIYTDINDLYSLPIGRVRTIYASSAVASDNNSQTDNQADKQVNNQDGNQTDSLFYVENSSETSSAANTSIITDKATWQSLKQQQSEFIALQAQPAHADLSLNSPFYAVSMADWLDTKDLQKQIQAQQRAVDTWITGVPIPDSPLNAQTTQQATTIEHIQEQGQTISQRQINESIALLVQEVDAQGVSSYSMGFINPEKLA
ncbi:metallophosphoesterase family protein [Psittacicella hinzii]|uniref:Uncharacterized protein n=1 Tax=Psittacicella hinzii TaxID=2028575 RepID=A0A3A1YPV7_9GAMM|nr:metallophosphoesterase [Psittacicella hinzii]RIY40323.1 hypothetical protein CKF58_00730 [Psittacicella hinzii]